jgi:hypothetical protein
VKTRCERCGTRYSTRRIGETCGDRNHRTTATPLPCPGRLIRPEDYSLFKKIKDRRAPAGRTNPNGSRGEHRRRPTCSTRRS